MGSADATSMSAGERGAQRNIVLTVNEWKTDIFANIKLVYDLVLQVFDGSGTELAMNSSSGEEGIGGGGLSNSNSNAATAAFETKIGRLMNSPDILEALAD